MAIPTIPYKISQGDNTRAWGDEALPNYCGSGLVPTGSQYWLIQSGVETDLLTPGRVYKIYDQEFDPAPHVAQCIEISFPGPHVEAGFLSDDPKSTVQGDNITDDIVKAIAWIVANSPDASCADHTFELAGLTREQIDEYQLNVFDAMGMARAAIWIVANQKGPETLRFCACEGQAQFDDCTPALVGTRGGLLRQATEDFANQALAYAAGGGTGEGTGGSSSTQSGTQADGGCRICRSEDHQTCFMCPQAGRMVVCIRPPPMPADPTMPVLSFAGCPNEVRCVCGRLLVGPFMIQSSSSEDFTSGGAPPGQCPDSDDMARVLGRDNNTYTLYDIETEHFTPEEAQRQLEDYLAHANEIKRKRRMVNERFYRTVSSPAALPGAAGAAIKTIESAAATGAAIATGTAGCGCGGSGITAAAARAAPAAVRVVPRAEDGASGAGLQMKLIPSCCGSAQVPVTADFCGNILEDGPRIGQEFYIFVNPTDCHYDFDLCFSYTAGYMIEVVFYRSLTQGVQNLVTHRKSPLEGDFCIHVHIEALPQPLPPPPELLLPPPPPPQMEHLLVNNNNNNNNSNSSNSNNNNNSLQTMMEILAVTSLLNNNSGLNSTAAGGQGGFGPGAPGGLPWRPGSGPWYASPPCPPGMFPPWPPGQMPPGCMPCCLPPC